MGRVLDSSAVLVLPMSELILKRAFLKENGIRSPNETVSLNLTVFKGAFLYATYGRGRLLRETIVKLSAGEASNG